jgi:hypothetical protein
MSEKMALETAIDLKLSPSLVRWVRLEPLPDGVVTLLRIAAGDDEVERNAAEAMGRSRELVRSAAAFFIEQILFAPDADSYRVLGATPQASASELRQHVGLLMRWVHPDLDPKGERSKVGSRVTAAWNDLKTPERRTAYDQAQRLSRTVHSHRGRASTASRPTGRRGPTPDVARPAQAAFGRRRVVSSPMESFWQRALWVLRNPAN